jgi:hypothetical protein
MWLSCSRSSEVLVFYFSCVDTSALAVASRKLLCQAAQEVLVEPHAITPPPAPLSAQVGGEAVGASAAPKVVVL